MKNIVEEVLNKHDHNRKNPLDSVHLLKADERIGKKKPSNIPGLNRPNYQKMKQDQRLAFDQEIKESKMQKIPTCSYQDSNSYKESKDFNKGLSQLNTMALVQGRSISKDNISEHKNTVKHQKKSPKLVGKTKDGSFVWFFPQVSSELAPRFKRAPNGDSVGVITSKICMPSQLLIVNDVMRENKDARYHLKWDENGNTPFAWELYDRDEARLERRLQNIFQIVQRKSLKSVDCYTVMSPSAWLSKQLNLSTAVKAVSILEGIPFYASLLILEQYFCENESQAFQYQVGNNFLLLSGEHEGISKVIIDFKRKAETFI
jgi:hypothetical protein